jgi:hypothetical protein
MPQAEPLEPGGKRTSNLDYGVISVGLALMLCALRIDFDQASPRRVK